MKRRVEVGRRTLTLSNLDKVFWPREGFTKADLIDYYFAVTGALLPHLRGRPLVVTRYPDGIEGKSFYQKDRGAYAPEWIETFPFYTEHSQRTIDFYHCHDAATLVWLANQACIELHPWLSKAVTPDFPDFAIFDLDPAEGATFADSVEIAFVVREVLAGAGLTCYPKTSGATGLHLYLPIATRYPYKAVADFVGSVADAIHRLLPGKTTRERTVAKRRGVYIDHLQNIKGKTIASVYSVRPRHGAPVSTPVTWEELEGLDASRFNIATVPARLGQVGDLFAPVLEHPQLLKSHVVARY